MAIQQQIAAEISAAKIGQTIKVVIDRLEGDYFIGRTEYDSPEVDGEVLIPATSKVETGNYYLAKITSADDFDLYGEIYPYILAPAVG
jgi:ribosomal protein S12 methylthiotransferase